MAVTTNLEFSCLQVAELRQEPRVERFSLLALINLVGSNGRRPSVPSVVRNGRALAPSQQQRLHHGKPWTVFLCHAVLPYGDHVTIMYGTRHKSLTDRGAPASVTVCCHIQ